MVNTMRRLHMGCGEALSGERYQLTVTRWDVDRRRAESSNSVSRGGHKMRRRNEKRR